MNSLAPRLLILTAWIPLLGCQPAATIRTSADAHPATAGSQRSTLSPQDELMNEKSEPSSETAEFQVATFGGGCFWCVEAVYQEVAGVRKVVSGYSGGHVPNPTYEQICGKQTGHAEVCRIEFDPKQVSYEKLLEIFWKTHDPTTPNRQGNDEGPQYRSVVFHHTPEQKELAEHYKTNLDASGAFNAPIVTEILPAPEFYAAEDYHQNYFRNNPQQGYCQFVIVPKLEKFRQVFAEQRKE